MEELTINSKKPVLLLVDDNEDILEFLKDDLEELYEIHTALDGMQALAIIRDQVIDLIVSDVMMPEMDGFELCAKLKGDMEFSHIPIILLTAKNTLQSKIEGLNIGADAYIEKPFSPEYLQAQISSLLNNRFKLKEYFANNPLVHFKSMAHSKMDEEFLEKLNEFIEANITNPNLDVGLLAHRMNMSKPTLYRKIKDISNLTPSEMIHLTRLKKATALLLESNQNIKDIAETMGYASHTHFGRNFQKQFNMTPSEYIKKVKTGS